MIKNNKKGFISSFTIYSFFIVLILLMIATLLTYTYKKKLASSTKVNAKIKTLSACQGQTLADCLLITNYYDDTTKTYDDLNIDKIKASIKQYTNSDSSSSGLFKTSDESSTYSYFYRGNITNNYVNFAGFRWRVIRINGTGDVRLILDTYNNASSLQTNYNDYSSNIGNLQGDTKESIGLISGQSSTFNNKDEIYGNINNSDILNLLYEFYDNNLKDYSSYISSNDYYCANKNPITDDDKQSDEEFKKIVESICNKSGWEWACKNNFAKELNYANYKQIYYGELLNVMGYLDDKKTPSYVCQNSGETAKSVCNKATNLSTYSTSGKTKYAFDYTNLSLDNIKDTSLLDKIKSFFNSDDKISTLKETYYKCGYQKDGSTVYIDSYLKNLVSSGKIIYSGQDGYESMVGNGSLEKPIGLISATEAYLSGVGFDPASTYQSHDSSISSETFSNYWTSSAALSDLTPNVLQEGKEFGFTEGLYYLDQMSWYGNYYFAVNYDNNLKFTLGFIKTYNNNSSVPYARPVINLKSCVKYTSGDGTKDNPYVISDTGC